MKYDGNRLKLSENECMKNSINKVKNEYNKQSFKKLKNTNFIEDYKNELKFEKHSLRQTGITIIALVITIIILLILAGVAISSVEQNKLILQAKKTSDDTKNAKTDELIKTAISSAEIDGLGELKDTELRQNLDSTFKGAGKDYSVSGDETKGWTVGIDGKDYIISPTGANYDKSDGDSKEWEVTGNAVTKYLGTSNDIVVPNYVNGTVITAIGENIFKDSDKTGTLKISEGIEKIGEYAFKNSKFTGSLEIPGSVKEIDTEAFHNCTGFNGTLTLNNGIEVIETAAFNSCSNFIGNLIIPQSVSIIDLAAFQNCSKFTGDLNITGNVQTIGDVAFDHCSGFNGRLILNNGTKKIGNMVFRDCSNLGGDIEIPSSIEKTGSAIVVGCTKLNGKIIVKKGAKIGGNIFVNGSGTEIIIQDNVESEGSPFWGNKFTSMYIGKNSKVMINGGVEGIKSAIFYSLPTDLWGIQFFRQMKICWISKETILNINELAIQQDGLAPSNLKIYTDASADDKNWPSDFPKDSLPNGITMHYNTSETDFRKLEY